MSENQIVEAVVALLVLLGTGITLISSLGVIRLPDVYTRAHATTKSATLGILCILLAAFVHFAYFHEIVSVRLLLGIVFVFLTAPVAGHMIIRSAHRTGVPLSEISVQDMLKEDLDRMAKRTAPDRLETADAATGVQDDGPWTEREEAAGDRSGSGAEEDGRRSEDGDLKKRASDETDPPAQGDVKRRKGDA